VDCSWGHRRRASALRLLIQLFLDEGVLRSYQSNFLSRKSLTASQNEAKEKWKGKYSKQGQMPPPLPL
jgi:hypothetical protein